MRWQPQRWPPCLARRICKRRLSSCQPRWNIHKHYDVVIAGGGIMGCSSAYFLAKRIPPSSICVLERDAKYERASTTLSIGSIRQQFSLKENILLSRFSYKFIQDIGHHLLVEGEDPPDVQFVNSCYLFLASERGEKTLRENYETQTKEGAKVELLTPKMLKEVFPWMNLGGVVLGSRGLNHEGWFDPWLFLQAFRKKIVSMGVNVINAEVVGVNVHDNKVQEAKIALPQADGSEDIFTCRHFVNASGPWASRVAQMAGIGDRTSSHSAMTVGLPVAARRRCIFVVRCPGTPDAPRGITPLVVDTDGIFFRTETSQNTYITGMSPTQDEDKDDPPLEVDYSKFDDTIWPSLANRVPAFEALKVQSAWAGYYDYNTFDQNGIIGTHPVITNFIFANGFSGHGIQQSPAVGRAVSEIIVDGRSHSIDLKRLSFQRIIDNAPLKEKNIV